MPFYDFCTPWWDVGAGHRLLRSSGSFYGVTLGALELQNTSVRFGGLQLLCFSAPAGDLGGLRAVPVHPLPYSVCGSWKLTCMRWPLS